MKKHRRLSLIPQLRLDNHYTHQVSGGARAVIAIRLGDREKLYLFPVFFVQWMRLPRYEEA